MSMDMDQVQRRDIDTALERITLGIDEENVTSSPYQYWVTSFVGNNWVMDEIGGFVKYSLAEDDSISFPVSAITSLAYKDITNVTVSFDYEVSTKCVLKNVGFNFAEQTLYESVETVLNGQGHIDVECSLFGFESDLLNTAISEQGFSIVLNFDGVKSNALVILRNVTFDLSFSNDLMSESDAVVNRVNFQTDFYNDDESVVLKVGEVEYPIKLADLFGSAFYDYNLYANNYNPKIDTTILVTCQVKNILGNPVANKELILYYKGIAEDPVRTNANGIAEWIINVGTTNGTYKIAVNNQYIFINIGGYQTYNGTHYTAKYNQDIVNIDFSWDTTSTFSANTSWTEFTTVTIPSHLRPTESIILNTHYNGLQINIQPNGVCRWANRSNTSITNPQLHFTVTYRKGDTQ